MEWLLLLAAGYLACCFALFLYITAHLLTGKSMPTLAGPTPLTTWKPPVPPRRS